VIAARGVDKIDPLLARLTSVIAFQCWRARSSPNWVRSLCGQGRLKQVSAALMVWHRHDELSQRLTQIPGVGPIGATMLALKTRDPSGFRSSQSSRDRRRVFRLQQ
jgi:transposase